MSVRIAFYHPDRLVIGLFEGQMQLSDFVEFALEIQKNNLIHYRKILNVIDAHPGFTEQELRALVRLIREAPTDKPRGAVAFVADLKKRGVGCGIHPRIGWRRRQYRAWQICRYCRRSW